METSFVTFPVSPIDEALMTVVVVVTFFVAA